MKQTEAKNQIQLSELLQTQLRSEVVSSVRVLSDKGLTLGFAESCTGGLLSSYFTEVSGVSRIFMGSVVSYDNKVKENLLRVSGETLKTQGAVSAETAKQMAKGAINVLGSSVAVSITGIAGPNGGSEQKPVGIVFIAVAGLGREAEVFEHRFKGDRKEVQLQSCAEAVRHLNDFIK